MRTKDLQLNKLQKTNIKSKLWFVWKFNDEIKKTIEILWEFLDKNLENDYDLDFVETGVRSIKIKVNDENKFIFRTVNCVFDYTSVDEKYWNSRIELTFTELSQKPRYSLVWKYNILNREKINSDVLKYIIKWLEEIYE